MCDFATDNNQLYTSTPIRQKELPEKKPKDIHENSLKSSHNSLPLDVELFINKLKDCQSQNQIEPEIVICSQDEDDSFLEDILRNAGSFDQPMLNMNCSDFHEFNGSPEDDIKSSLETIYEESLSDIEKSNDDNYIYDKINERLKLYKTYQSLEEPEKS